DAGVRKVVVAAPVKEGALNVVMGVNDHLYRPSEHRMVTAASCTTNCLAPVVKVIHESLGIRHGVITTIHDVTNTQTVVDAPHKDLRRARASSLSLIPTTTGSATAIALIYPQLKGKLNGLAASLQRRHEERRAQLRARHRRLLGLHAHRRRAADARALALPRARVFARHARVLVLVLRILRRRHEPVGRVSRGARRAEAHAHGW